MQLSQRDQEILKIVKDCPTTSKYLAEYFGTNYRNINKRLQTLYENSYLNRVKQEVFNGFYVYYEHTKNPPKQIDHLLQLSKFYLNMKNTYEVLLFLKQKKIYTGIVPDGILVFKDNSNTYMQIIEVDLTTNPNKKLKKYEEYYNNCSYIEYTKIPPNLIFITDQPLMHSKIEQYCTVLPLYK